MRRNMKKEVIFVLLTVLFLFTACTADTTPSDGEKVYIGGDIGLEISLVPGEPPKFVSDDNKEEFDVSVLLKNVGEDDIGNGEIISTLQNINKDLFSLPSLSVTNNFELESKKLDRGREIEGDQEELTFENLKYTEDLGANFNVNLRVDVCYDYSTKASAKVCLKKDPTRRRTRDVCEVDNENVAVDNSGAPVKIKNMAQFPRSDSVRLTFDVESLSEIYEPGTFTTACTVDEEREDMVYLKLTSPSRLDIECSKLGGDDEGVVELFEGVRTISCNIDTTGLQSIAFEERINIKADYVVKDSVSTSFVVEAE